MSSSRPDRGRARFNILIFGFASLLTDVAGEMIAPVLPLFMSAVLHLDKVFIGLVEGIAESTASLAKLVSGWLSDRLPRRKPSIIAGYALSSLGKPMLALARSGGQVIAARFVDRAGKGIRTSPRDALLAESVPAERRGLAFGFHRSMDSAGAIVGPGLAALLLAWKFDYTDVFWWAFLPAVLAVAMLFAIREEPKAAGRPADPPGTVAHGRVAGLGWNFYLFLAACALFTLGNSSDAFIVLRAQGLGVPTALIPVLWMVLNISNTLVATPAGWLSDRLGRKRTVLAGLLIYTAVYAGLASAFRGWQVWPLMALYGVYYGLADGGFRAMVADLVPGDRLGTAYGLYHTVAGMTLLPASLLLGLLWESAGHRTAFLTGSALALAAALLLARVRVGRGATR